MNRTLLSNLREWLNATDRKPLVIRGARQVGKTWLVRYFAKSSGKQLIEINFEKNLAAVSLFSSNNVDQILLNLSTVIKQDIDPKNCLLFLDEIQAAPQIFSMLRWFAEDLPQLPVIAAGSLLEFMLTDYAFSMPVGRINYFHLEPMSFEEFLLAKDENYFNYLSHYNFNFEIPIGIHEQLVNLFKEYLLVGGMPAAVSNWIEKNSLQKVNQIQNDLLATYRDDFSGYKGRIAIEKLDEVLMAIPKMLGQKFKFSHVNPQLQTYTVKHILDLFSKARISHRVLSCAANGVPLAAEINEKFFKEIFIDVGLCCSALGLSLQEINRAHDITLINKGGIAEQVVGQMLRTINPPYIEPALYYWQREEKGASSEVDYVIQYGNKVIPIEVKAGSTGSLKSLHLFMGLKKFKRAVRINSDLPSQTDVKTKDSLGNAVEYKLLSIPFYLVGKLNKLFEFHIS